MGFWRYWLGLLLLLLVSIGCQTAAADRLPPPNTLEPPLAGETAVPPTIIPDPQSITLHQGRSVRLLWTQQPTLGAFLDEAGITIHLTDQVYADDTLVPLESLDEWLLPSVVEIGRYFTITIQDDEQQMVVQTAVPTVAEALQEAGITLFAADQVAPALENQLEAGMTIRVQRSIPLTIQVDGRILQTRSAFRTPREVLAEAAITLIDADFTRPDLGAILQAGDTIQVIRVTEDFRLEDEPIPYQTLWQASPELDLDTQAVISPGVPGILRRRIRIRYENGTAVGEEVDGEWMETDPVNEVIGYGTRITTGVVQTEQGSREYWRIVRMRVTSYTPASSGRPPDDPHYGITASGLPAGFGVVAIDRNIVPWKSELFVPGYGVALAGDTGGGVRGRWIDLGYPDDAFEAWSGYVDVYYLTPIPPPEDINYLLPSVLP